MGCKAVAAGPDPPPINAVAAAADPNPPPINEVTYQMFQQWIRMQQQGTKRGLSSIAEEEANKVGTGPVDPELKLVE